MRTISRKQTGQNYRLHSFQSAGGFTLLEIMLVVAIIAILLGAAIYSMTGHIESAKNVVAQGEIATFTSQLTTYQMNAGHYPTTAQGLKSLVEEPSIEPKPKRWTQLAVILKKDPWNNDYLYVFPGKRNKKGFDLSSNGADGIENTADDISNWRQ